MSIFRYPNLVTIGGLQLTDESRQPIAEERDAREIRVELASGKIRKFTKEIRRKFSISWDMVAADAAHTIDGGASRNELRALVQGGNGPFTMTLTDGKNGTETYTVWVTGFTTNLKMRRSDTFYYSMSLSLEEQG